MLATFTANLAAFLTVERMQTTVQGKLALDLSPVVSSYTNQSPFFNFYPLLGLEELAQQSKINYTVAKDSPYYEYFKNMAGAEEDLYRVWKDLTLSSNADQSK